MKKFYVALVSLLLAALTLCVLASAIDAQERAAVSPGPAVVPLPPPAKAAPSADIPKLSVVAPVSMTMPEFLARYDKFIALGEARAAAEKKRAEYEAAVKVLNEQLEEKAAELRAQIPKDAVWDPAKRALVRVSAPPAPEKKP